MLRVAIMGATGAVGLEMLKILEERKFPCTSLKLLASQRSAGKELLFRGKPHGVEQLTKNSFKDIDLVLSSAGASVSKEFVPAAVEQGAVVVDNTSAYRMEPDVPLIVPEVNPHAIARHKGIIANPNCSTIQMVVVLHPLHQAVGIKRVVVATYQSVSGTGLEAVEELREQSLKILQGDRDFTPSVYPHQIAFNCLPHIDVFFDNGYSKEEMKMVLETKKILEDDSIAVTATTVRVPVFRGHSEAVNIETHKKITAQEVRELLGRSPGVVVVDDPKKCEYPLAIDCENRNETFVGRIREDVSCESGIDLWVVSDNLRKGAAWNAVQIAEQMLTDGLLPRK